MRRLTLGVLGALALIAAPPTATAADPHQTPTIRGARTVSADEAHALIHAGAVAVDLRDLIAFDRVRLPGARAGMAGFDRDSGRFDAAVFGVDRAAPIIIYHDGPAGVAAYRAIQSAIGAGFSQLLWLRGGLREWVAMGHATESSPAANRAAAVFTDR